MSFVSFFSLCFAFKGFVDSAENTNSTRDLRVSGFLDCSTPRVTLRLIVVVVVSNCHITVLGLQLKYEPRI